MILNKKNVLRFLLIRAIQDTISEETVLYKKQHTEFADRVMEKFWEITKGNFTTEELLEYLLDLVR